MFFKVTTTEVSFNENALSCLPWHLPWSAVDSDIVGCG